MCTLYGTCYIEGTLTNNTSSSTIYLRSSIVHKDPDDNIDKTVEYSLEKTTTSINVYHTIPCTPGINKIYLSVSSVNVWTLSARFTWSSGGSGAIQLL